MPICAGRFTFVCSFHVQFMQAHCLCSTFRRASGGQRPVFFQHQMGTTCHWRGLGCYLRNSACSRSWRGPATAPDTGASNKELMQPKLRTRLPFALLPSMPTMRVFNMHVSMRSKLFMQETYKSPYAARTAQEWFNQLPDDTARSIVNLRQVR